MPKREIIRCIKRVLAHEFYPTRVMTDHRARIAADDVGWPAPTERIMEATLRDVLTYRGVNGQMESFWARMQVELLNRKRWNTRLELANAIFEYPENFHNWQRRHSSLGMLSPIEYELRHAGDTARDQAS